MRTAEIFEEYGLKASFNVIATGHWQTFIPPDEYQEGIRKGNFTLWNSLQNRGHEVMPHGYKHSLLPILPPKESLTLVRQCLDIFEDELEGFDRKRTIFHFPYNSATPQLESWAVDQARAYRVGGGGQMPLPYPGQKKLTCSYFGPASCEVDLEREIATLLARPSGWLVYNVHGLDGQGWGTMSSSRLDRLLSYLVRIPSLAILPPGAAMDLMESYRR